MNTSFSIAWPDVHEEMTSLQLSFARTRLISIIKTHILPGSLPRIRDTFILANRMCDRLIDLAQYFNDICSPLHRNTIFGAYVSAGPVECVLKTQCIQTIEDLVDEVTCFMLQRGDYTGHTFKHLHEIKSIARGLNRLIKEMIKMKDNHVSLLRALGSRNSRLADVILSGFDQHDADEEADQQDGKPWRRRLSSVKEYCDRNGYFVQLGSAIGDNESTGAESSFTQMRINRNGTHSVEVHNADGTHAVRSEAWTNPAPPSLSSAFREAPNDYYWPTNFRSRVNLPSTDNGQRSTEGRAVLNDQSRVRGARGAGNIGSQSRGQSGQQSLPFSQIPGLVGSSSLAVSGQQDDAVSHWDGDGDSDNAFSASEMAADVSEEMVRSGALTDPSFGATERSKNHQEETEEGLLDAP